MGYAPLTITYNNQYSKISLDTNKFITNRLESVIETKLRPVNQRPYTEVRILLPTNQLSYNFMNELKEYCLVYSIFSTHITFFLDFDGIKTTTPIAAMASNTWTNEITVWAYIDNEFLIYIANLVNRSMSVATALTGFRELKWLPMIKRIEESIPSLYDRLDLLTISCNTNG